MRLESNIESKSSIHLFKSLPFSEAQIFHSEKSAYFQFFNSYTLNRLNTYFRKKELRRFEHRI